MRQRTVLGALFVIMSCGVMGCATGGQSGSKALETQLDPAVIQKFQDIPVPSNFTLNVRNSYAFLNADIRVGVLKYSGKAYQEAVIKFFKEQMPLYNWNFLNIVEYGVSILNFEKGGETCSVLVEGKGNKSSFVVSIGPKATHAMKNKEKNEE